MPPPIGRPMLNTRLYVLDEHRQLVVTGAIGELYIGGEGVAKGYLRRPELNQQVFSCIHYRGRRAHVSYGRSGSLDRRWTARVYRPHGRSGKGGHRIELGEIENLLLQHEAVAEATVVSAHRDGDGTVSLASYLVGSEDHLIDLDILRVFLAGRLPDYMMPDSFIVLDVMPLTPNGKLDRKVLRHHT